MHTNIKLYNSIFYGNLSIFSTILIVITLLMPSCDSPVGFTEAQPGNALDLSALPKAFQGMFICQSDSILVKVLDQAIYSEITELALIPMSYIAEREECEIVNDGLPH